METETLLKSNFEDNRENIYSCLWDFAGQSVYYVTHLLFLTARAIYVLVYNLSVNPDHPAKPLMKQGVCQKNQDTFNLNTNLDYLDFWIRSVASLSKKCSHDHENTAKIPTGAGLLPHRLPSVFLVCTHADTPYDKKKDPRDLAYGILGRLRQKPYSVHLFDVYVVDNRKSGTAFECSEVRRLRQQVLAAAEQLPYINEAIPIKWLKFERAIAALKKQKKGNKCISLKDAEDIASNDCNVTEKRESKKILGYLHDLRSIVHFDDPPEFNKLVVLDPQWLIDVFKKVITVQPAYQCEEKKLLDKWNKLEACGLLDENLLRHIWKSLSDDEETYQSLVEIMEKFGLMCPWPLDASGNKSHLVPSTLKSRPPKEISERHEFCWLKNMRYDMCIICQVCCHRGGVNFCLAHCKQGCKEEECLHFWPISKLRTVKSATVCTRSASAKNPRAPVSQFTHWFPAVSHKVSQSGTGDSYQNFASSSEGPLLSENLDVREILFEQGRQLTIALSGGNKWKLVAEKLGLNPREIRYLDNRIRNPAEAVLGFVAEKRGLTVGELYDILSNCGLPLLADELLRQLPH
ncbi:probable serine/threonine-protein kinase roco4 [Montipora foliosa]|uniref:probable serine/threonine-protein kinase roco4 n=1 Tax=Montipora foliosa TaxID=591990 RepID=UPI0035F15239